MVTKKRVSKRPLGSGTEEIQELGSPLLLWARRYRIPITAGLSVLVFALLVALGVRYLNSKKEEKAITLFSEAYQTLQKASQDGKPLDESLKLLEAIEQKYPHTAAGRLCLFYIGNCKFTMNKIDDSITCYTRFAEAMESENPLILMAYDSLGYCYEEKKDYKKAREYFEKTITPPPGLGESGYFNIARCYEALGDTGNALKIYKQIAAEFPSSPRASLVQEKIKTLAIRG